MWSAHCKRPLANEPFSFACLTQYLTISHISYRLHVAHFITYTAVYIPKAGHLLGKFCCYLGAEHLTVQTAGAVKSFLFQYNTIFVKILYNLTCQFPPDTPRLDHSLQGLYSSYRTMVRALGPTHTRCTHSFFFFN